MQIKNLALIASLFALGCGKSDEERLDDLVEGCESVKTAYNSLADSPECDFLDRWDFDCEEQKDLIEENGCLDEAEASLECLEGIDYEKLYCDEAALEALATCADEGEAVNACIGDDIL